ncbi:MAG: anhydro-N-acetylmuramic acid kinase [Nitrospirota bacterium]|nr:anhydro-N-acetylmuramic acid kinase [Nitrospirota bacterium]
MIVKDTLLAIGLMSGTSADGIDAALVTVERAPRRVTLRHYLELPMPSPLRARILAAANGTSDSRDQCLLGAALGEAFGSAARSLCGAAGVSAEQVDVVGSHGQTVWHAPEATPPATLQIGNPAQIAAICRIPVVADFRSADLAQGGQGAPLTPRLHHLLLAHPQRDRAVVNIGGIANMSWLPGGRGTESVVSFDTGPGNMVIDAVTAHQTGGVELCDRGGERAARGKVQPMLLDDLLRHPFFTMAPPKSSGREMFGANYVRELFDRAEKYGVQGDDLVSTVTAMTAQTIARAVEGQSARAEVLVCGGGARNATLMGMLEAALPKARVASVETCGVASDSMEAVAFAELACCYLWGESANIPAVTGARQAVVLGSLTPAPGRAGFPGMVLP